MALCKHHAICGLEAFANTDLCILHRNSHSKKKEAFDEALATHRERNGDNFSHFVFPGDTDFSGAAFGKGPDFSNATFTGGADFREVAFTGQAIFSRARFVNQADFTAAAFADDAVFSGAEFVGAAKFEGVEFARKALFSEVKFAEGCSFSGAGFKAYADFTYAAFADTADFEATFFEDNANFGHTVFGAGADFSETSFAKGTNFSRATFAETASFIETEFIGPTHFVSTRFDDCAVFVETDFNDSADFRFSTFTEDADFSGSEFLEGADFGRTSFSGGADFGYTTFAAKADFKGATFFGKTVFFPPDSGLNPSIFSEAEVDFRAVIINPLDALTIRDVDLTKCRFQGTDLRKAEITNASWPKISGTRFGVYDEIAPLEEGQTRAWSHIEKVYRELKQNYEDRRDYERAGDFHHGEKEMRRKNPATGYGLKLLLYVYWSLSGYGEKALRPLVCAAGLLLICAFLYLVVGVCPKGGSQLSWTNLSDWPEAVLYSFRVMTLLKPEELGPISDAKLVHTLIYTFESIAGPVLLGLFGLALRQRLKR